MQVGVLDGAKGLQDGGFGYARSTTGVGVLLGLTLKDRHQFPTRYRMLSARSDGLQSRSRA